MPTLLAALSISRVGAGLRQLARKLAPAAHALVMAAVAVGLGVGIALGLGAALRGWPS